MKRLLKLFSTLIAVMLVCICCVSTGCGANITTAEVTLQLYDYDNAEYFDQDDVKITVDLYGHLAPKTVEAMTKYINEGYYNNAIIYKMTDFNQIMVGDLVLADGAEGVVIEDEGATVNIIQNPVVKPTLPGEFEYGGTKGSNLTNKKGAIGLWRSWYALGTDWMSSAALRTGRATWYMPTETLGSYDDYFCVFGQLDFEQEATEKAFSKLTSIFSNTKNYTTFIIYFTGEYDATKPDQNHGLTFHCVTQEYLDNLDEDEKEALGIFEAEGAQLECYNQYKIRVANNSSTGKLGAMVKSAKTV